MPLPPTYHCGGIKNQISGRCYPSLWACHQKLKILSQEGKQVEVPEVIHLLRQAGLSAGTFLTQTSSTSASVKKKVWKTKISANFSKYKTHNSGMTAKGNNPICNSSRQPHTQKSVQYLQTFRKQQATGGLNLSPGISRAITLTFGHLRILPIKRFCRANQAKHFSII